MDKNKSKNDIQLNKIVSPSLSDTGYAAGLSTVFDNINTNFNVLANRDFVKGETGDSLSTQIVYFTNDDGTLNEYGNKLKSCIIDASSEDDRKSIYDNYSNEISLWDIFDTNPGYLYMMFGKNPDVVNAIEEPLTSFYYVFLDGRYATSKLTYLDHDQYNDIKDLSCVLVYDYNVNGFKIISNLYPTMYFDAAIGLCWKINGIETGLPIQGVQGKPGLNSPVTIVKCDELELNDDILYGKISAIFDSTTGYNPIKDNSIQEYETLINGTCLIMSSSVEGNGNDFYFGTIRELNNKLYCFCSHETAINDVIRKDDFNNAMKNISTRTINGLNDNVKGLFVPITNENDHKQAVHILTSVASSKSIYDNTSNKNDLIISPINDINGIDTDKSNLLVDRYLYIRVNKNSKIFENNSVNDDVYRSVFGNYGISRYDYILKYKFVDKVNKLFQDENTTIVNPNFDIFENSHGSRYFTNRGVNYGVRDNAGNELNRTTIKIDDNNVAYYNGNTNVHFTEHWKTIPNEFLSALNSESGIYRWDLCDIKHDWDLDGLKNNETNDKYYYSDVLSDSNNPSELVNALNTIFTTSISPDSMSNILWFNGFCLDERLNNGYQEDRNKYVIPGWNYELFPDVLEFIRHISIIDNAYNQNTKNGLTLNYDVNITGCDNDFRKNLYVSGNTTTDELLTHHLTLNDGKYSFGFGYNQQSQKPELYYKKFDSKTQVLSIEDIFKLVEDVKLIKEQLNITNDNKVE